MKRSRMLTLFGVLWLMVAGPAMALPFNGEFADGLGGWTRQGDVSELVGVAALGDGLSVSRLWLAAPMAPGPYVLQFDFQGRLSSAVAPGGFQDVFFASLYLADAPDPFGGASGVGLFDLIGTEFVPGLAQVGPSPLAAGWLRCSYSITLNRTHAIPVFEIYNLNGIPGDSWVLVDQVRLTLIPEPATPVLMFIGLALLHLLPRRHRRRGGGGHCVIFVAALLAAAAAGVGAAAEPISAYFNIETAEERTSLDRTTRQLTSTVEVTLTNLANVAVEAPLHAVVVNNPPGGVAMPGALGGPGAGPHGQYYFDLSDRLVGGVLEPGGSVGFTATFVRDDNTFFSYAFEVHGRLGHEPVRALALTVEPQALELDQPGQVGQLRVNARLADGQLIDVTSDRFGTRLLPVYPGLVALGPEGRVTALRPGATPLLVRNGDIETSIPVRVRFAPVAPTPGALAAFETLRDQLGDELIVEWDPLSGCARGLLHRGAYLTEPSADDPLEIVLRFLDDQRRLYQLDGEALAQLELVSRHRSSHNGLTHLTLAQRHEGIPVFGAQIQASVDAEGRIVSIAGPLAAGLKDGLEPALGPEEALARAAGAVAPGRLFRIERTAGPEGAERRTLFAPGPFEKGHSASLVIDPLGPAPRLAWLVLFNSASLERYAVLVDAASGEIPYVVNKVIVQ